MINGTIIDCGEYEQNGKLVYWITKEYPKYGTFNADATPCEEDLDIANDWDGFVFAEYKCDLQAQHRKAKNFYERYIESERIMRALKDSPFCNDEILEKLIHQCDIAWKEYKGLYNQYMNMRDGYKTFVKNRLATRREAAEKIADYRQRQEQTEE